MCVCFLTTFLEKKMCLNSSTDTLYNAFFPSCHRSTIFFSIRCNNISSDTNQMPYLMACKLLPHIFPLSPDPTSSFPLSLHLSTIPQTSRKWGHLTTTCLSTPCVVSIPPTHTHTPEHSSSLAVTSSTPRMVTRLRSLSPWAWGGLSVPPYQTQFRIRQECAWEL